VERVKILAMVRDSRIPGLNKFFGSEPAVDYKIVMTRNKAMPDPDLIKLIRLYFPRNYQEFREYDVLILAQPTYYLFTTKQDTWIKDAILDGAGGINDGSTFSQVPGIPEAWASGVAWEAFPNDAPFVVENHASWAPASYYQVDINENHPEPILTVFIPFGAERIGLSGVSRLVKPREGSEILAWQVGNYPTKQPLLTSWKYGEGRAMTLGAQIPGGWIKYPTGNTGENKYAPEILMNMMFWLAGTELIDDVEVFHRVKTDFSEFRARRAVLLSLSDFIDKLGANTQGIQNDVVELEKTYQEATIHYLEHDFALAEDSIREGLAMFPEVEENARREKNRALLWVYVIEWLVSVSTFFISGFLLWTLMVRRRLFREVGSTKLRTQL
jgi:hypothetical protein